MHIGLIQVLKSKLQFKFQHGLTCTHNAIMIIQSLCWGVAQLSLDQWELCLHKQIYPVATAVLAHLVTGLCGGRSDTGAAWNLVPFITTYRQETLIDL